MKREILCVNCKSKVRCLFSSDNPYPGEYVKFVDGNAIQQFTCDNCASTINMDDRCCAFSAWAEYGGIPYYEWENEYIKTNRAGAKHKPKQCRVGPGD